ncbi:MAG TPA: hypothetical protein DCS29_03240 [Candidatus Magasanikbacteria bacterium]|nr:hypothetical protein [Candidatus Magasanikbacteria bacterium]
MFDDQQPQNLGNVPGNLPTGEPEDVFANIELASSRLADVPSDPVAEEPLVPTSALGAGILRPKAVATPTPLPDTYGPVEPPMPPMRPSTVPVTSPNTINQTDGGVLGSNNDMAPGMFDNVAPSMTVPPPGMTPNGGNQNQMYDLKEPIGNKKTILWIIIVVIVVVLGAGSVWIYTSFMRDKDTSTNDFDVPTVSEGSVDVENTVNTSNSSLDTQNGSTQTSGQDTNTTGNNTTVDLQDRILFGEPIDTDGDGLDDVREADLDTDPLNWDTDGDELGDGDEVTIWKTDPLDSDTDGDTYLDGVEIKNGYSPTGSGKLFEPPTSTDGISQ